MVQAPFGTSSARDPLNDHVIEAELLDSEVVDEGVFINLLRRAGRQLAGPALEALELLLDQTTPTPVRLTMLAALSYLLMPADLIPDFLPVAGFSDDLVALTTMVGLWSNHVTPEIRKRAQRKLDHWFPLSH